MFTLLKMVQLNFEMWFPLKIKVALHSLSLSSCFHLSSNFRFFLSLILSPCPSSSYSSLPHAHPFNVPSASNSPHMPVSSLPYQPLPTSHFNLHVKTTTPSEEMAPSEKQHDPNVE